MLFGVTVLLYYMHQCISEIFTEKLIQFLSSLVINIILLQNFFRNIALIKRVYLSRDEWLS